MWVIFIDPCSKLKHLSKPPLTLGHGLLITGHYFMWMRLLIHVLIMIIRAFIVCHIRMQCWRGQRDIYRGNNRSRLDSVNSIMLCDADLHYIWPHVVSLKWEYRSKIRQDVRNRNNNYRNSTCIRFSYGQLSSRPQQCLTKRLFFTQQF